MFNKLRVLLALMLGTLVVLGTGACSTPGTNVSGLAAYGVQAGPVFDCYYAEDPSEVPLLIAAGLCPPGSVATPMPLSWRDTYYNYYMSSAYYSHYMPQRYWTAYDSAYGSHSHFYVVNHVTIAADYSKGSYRGTNGKVVTAPKKTGSLKFSSGNPVVHAPAVGGGGGSNRAPAKSVRGGSSGGTGGSKVTTRAPAKSVRR